MASIESRIRSLLNKGYSASKIAKTVHIRKQRALSIAREIQNKSINPHKITNLKGQVGALALDRPTQAFTEQLFKEGYSEKFVAKLVHAVYPETSQRKVRAYIRQYKQNNPEAVAKRKLFQQAVNREGKEYRRNRENGKFYRETNRQYFTEPLNFALYPEGGMFEETEDIEDEDGD